MSKPLKLVPKNLDDMLDAIACNQRSPLSDEAQTCKDLIGKCDDLVIEDDALLSIKEASERLGVSKQTLRNWELSGKLVPTEKTGSGHRRYLESQVNQLRKKQLGIPEIILPDVTVAKLKALGEMLLSSFSDDAKVNLIISQGVVDGKVRITIDSEDGLTTISKTFNVED